MTFSCAVLTSCFGTHVRTRNDPRKGPGDPDGSLPEKRLTFNIHLFVLSEAKKLSHFEAQCSGGSQHNSDVVRDGWSLCTVTGKTFPLSKNGTCVTLIEV